ncbi:MAG: aldehyde dehydrogenase family protein, partial [Acidobacteriota bacterium]
MVFTMLKKNIHTFGVGVFHNIIQGFLGDPVQVRLYILRQTSAFVWCDPAYVKLAGNTVLLKHASNVCGCALAIGEIFLRAGLPPAVFQTLLVDSR